MKRELALRWAKALESGLYPQTKGKLRDHKGLCCLGVLCSLHAEDHPEVAAKNKNSEYYEGEKDVLPTLVIEWANMKRANGIFFSDDGGGSLSEMNDGGKSFKEIAIVIRKHYKEL